MAIPNYGFLKKFPAGGNVPFGKKVKFFVMSHVATWHGGIWQKQNPFKGLEMKEKMPVLHQDLFEVQKAARGQIIVT